MEELRQTRTDSDSLVIAHSLNLVGLRWQLMTAMARSVLHRQHEVLAVSQHVCGRVGMDGISDISNASIFLDFPLDIMSMVPRFGSVTQDSIKLPLIVGGWLGSACEHAAIEQSAGELLENPVGVSTVRLVERHAAAGGRVYLLHTGNASTASLTGYPPSVQSAFLAALQNPADRLLVPSSGSIAMEGSSPAWSGYGYNLFNRYSSGFNYSANIIQRLKGGLSTKPGILTTIKNLFSLGNLGRSLQSFGQALVSGADPVDMASGGFMLDETDLELGGDEPRGLHLSRYYSSRDARSNQAGLGQGWTHSYHLRLHRRSAPVEAMGGGDPFQCAPFMAAVHAARDLWDDTKVNRWMLSLIACNWAVDQMLNNAAEIELGPRTLTFIRLPDGTYLPPTGVAATLTETTSGGLPTGYTLTMRHGNTILFDGTGRATTIRDPYNKELTLAYDTTPEKKLSNVTDAYSRSLTFNYTGTRLTGVSDSTGRGVTYSHDATGKKLESVTDVESKTTYYDTDVSFRVWRHRDHDNRVITENVFDSQDRVVEQKAMGDATRLWKLYHTGSSTIEQDPAGGRREFQWDEKHRLVAQVDQMGRKISFTYDGQDHRLRTKLPLGQVSESVYDAFHNATSVTVAPTEADLAVPASRRVTQLFYDPATQHLDYAIDPRNKTSQVRYNAYHQLDQAISAEGVKVESEFYAVGHAHAGLLWKKHVYRDATNKDTTTFAYDSNGHVQRIDYPDSTNVQFTHNARGDMLTSTDQRGHTTTFQHNSRRQPRFTFLPQVNGTTYQSEQQYDNAGNPSISIDAYSNTTTTLFNALRKPGTTTYQDTTTLTRDYDERDWLETVTDHLSHASTRSFHADGQPHEVFDPLTRKRVVSTYDGNGRPEYSSTPKPNTGTGRATSQTEYTGFGEVFKAHDPLGNFTQFQYDSGGNLQTRTNKRNHAWTFTYNDDNQLEDTTSPGNKTVQKRYNARGLLETVTEPSGQTTTFHYDSMGRVDDSVDAVGTIDYAYDEAGQSDTITEGATVIDRDYDALGRLTKYQHGTDYTLQWQYHDPQNAVSLVYPDGVKKVRYDFDNRGRLWKVTDWAGRITRYQYDDAGRLRWTHRDYNGTKREVKYDAASQIIAIEERDKNGRAIALFRYLEHWDNGQIKKTFTLPLPQPQALTLPIMTYNADNQLLTWKASAAAAAQSVVHDDDGNTTAGPLPDLSSPAAPARWASFGFDARNRLTSVTATGVSSTHSYDAENLRTSVTENGVTSQWVVNPHGLSGLSEALVRVKGGVTTRYVYGLGLLYEEEEAATPVVRTYHFDRQGSTAALTATDGLTVTDRFEYAAYGERTHRTGSTDTPFQFNGFFGVQTDASGLLYMRARYYNVETRRFQSADPMGFAESSNFYWFANADPVSLVDPFGLGASDGGGFWRGVGRVLGNVAMLPFKVVGSINILGNMADYMRARMTAQSKLDTGGSGGTSRNIGAPSVGHRSGGLFRWLFGLDYGGDGVKLGGNRFNASNPEAKSPLGWRQGEEGGLFWFGYSRGSFGDYLVEAFSGVHDYLNSWIFYDSSSGNIRQDISPAVSFLGEIANGLNVAVALPFVLPSVALPTSTTFD